MQQEQARLGYHSPLDAAHADLSASLANSAHTRQVFSNLARNGITWDDLKAVYSKAYPEFETGMLIFGALGDVTRVNCDLMVLEEEMSTD